jgi:phage regulator Rha-like protein
MSNVIPFISTQPTMTSLEISKLVEARHDKVKQSIERLAERQLFVLPPMGDVPFVDESGRNRTTSAYIFTAERKRDTYIVVAQLSPEFTARLVDRWQELEAGHAIPKVADPTLAALVQTVVELDQVKQQHAALVRKTEILENRVQNVELQHRNGVPNGYLSKKQAHHLYGEGLSEEIFHLALAKREVPIKNYIHRGEDGYESATFAYLESAIQEAVDFLIAEAEQVTPQMCQSPMLGGKRFRYVKDSANRDAAA